MIEIHETDKENSLLENLLKEYAQQFQGFDIASRARKDTARLLIVATDISDEDVEAVKAFVRKLNKTSPPVKYELLLNGESHRDIDAAVSYLSPYKYNFMSADANNRIAKINIK